MYIVLWILGLAAACAAVWLVVGIISSLAALYRRHVSPSEREHRRKHEQYLAWRAAHPDDARSADEYFGALDD